MHFILKYCFGYTYESTGWYNFLFYKVEKVMRMYFKLTFQTKCFFLSIIVSGKNRNQQNQKHTNNSYGDVVVKST